VLSIGGFLGMINHLIVVSHNPLTSGDENVTLPGGIKKALKMLPEFKYAAT
jgi:hypothetical protein